MIDLRRKRKPSPFAAEMEEMKQENKRLRKEVIAAENKVRELQSVLRQRRRGGW